MPKTLVIVLSETRAHELTFENFKTNVIDELNADLCVCIGVTPDYDYTNPYYQLAKYKFLYTEPLDYGEAFDYAYDIIAKELPKYEKLDNINALYGKLQDPDQYAENITNYGAFHNMTKTSFTDFDDDEIVIHTNDFEDPKWKTRVYGIKRTKNDNMVQQQNVITYKRPLHWREFLKIKYQFLGGIKDAEYQHPGSAGILIFFRWFLLKNLMENNLINEYDRFIITRSDFIYQLPHPKVEYMDASAIWIPDCEHYGGYTDRHAVLSSQNIEPYLNILNNMVLRSNDYFFKMWSKQDWNLEQFIKFHLERNQVQEFPYIMYSVRNISGTTRWQHGYYSAELGYYIKYLTEYEKSAYYKRKYMESGKTMDAFYLGCILSTSLL